MVDKIKCYRGLVISHTLTVCQHLVLDLQQRCMMRNVMEIAYEFSDQQLNEEHNRMIDNLLPIATMEDNPSDRDWNLFLGPIQFVFQITTCDPIVPMVF